MAKLKARELFRLCEQHGEHAVMKNLKGADTKVSLSDYSLRDLAETFLGEGWARKYKQMNSEEGFRLEEGGGQEVKMSLFSNVTGQLIYSEIRKQFDSEEFKFSPLVPTIHSAFDGTEKVPSITPIGDKSELVGEGQEYPSVGIGEEYFTIPAKAKRGMKIEVTEEAIFFDRTGMVTEQAGAIGYWLALKKEKDVIDCFTGHVNNYIRNGTGINTYMLSGAYINNQSSTPLADWTDIDAAEQLFTSMLDPTTSEPLSEFPASESQIIVMPYGLHNAKHIVNATSLRDTTTSAAEFASANSVAAYNIMTSKLLYNRVLATIEPTPSTAKAIWWLGSIQRLLAYYENWPLGVFKQGPDSNAGFERDISMRFKARMRGVVAVREPRYMVRMEGTAV